MKYAKCLAWSMLLFVLIVLTTVAITPLVNGRPILFELYKPLIAIAAFGGIYFLVRYGWVDQRHFLGPYTGVILKIVYMMTPAIIMGLVAVKAVSYLAADLPPLFLRFIFVMTGLGALILFVDTRFAAIMIRQDELCPPDPSTIKRR
jgi:hypothetical protein